MSNPRNLARIVLLLLVPALATGQGLPPRDGLPPLGTKPLPGSTPLDQLVRPFELKFRDGVDVRAEDGRFVGSDAGLPALNELLRHHGATAERVFELQSDLWLDAWRRQGEQRSGWALHDLRLFFRVRTLKPVDAAIVLDALNRYEIVEVAYPLPQVEDPVVPPVARRLPGGLASRPSMLPTPDFRSLQGYRTAAPTGVDADFAAGFFPSAGLGVRIADVETGWTHDHEDLDSKAVGAYVGLAMTNYPWDHGTAVLGELVGENNDLGVLGICHEASIKLSTHQGSTANIPTAIAAAVATLVPGDVLVLEVQCSGGPPGPYPCEYAASTFAAVQTATANGIHVTAAAGNGNRDLDASAYGGLFDRAVRDSGAVLCGASNGSSLAKASFSNYGSRVDVHGWGFNVMSAGYGDYYGGAQQLTRYTNVFSGTSSATPIVTGALVVLEALHESVFGTPVPPLQLRARLSATGTPQTSGGPIGPRPNLKALIRDFAIPEIEVVGTWTRGGTATIRHRGAAGRPYYLGVAVSAATTPQVLPPLGGALLLGDPVLLIDSGALDATGLATTSVPIPNDPALAGFTGVLQGLQVFPSGATPGALTNVASFSIL